MSELIQLQPTDYFAAVGLMGLAIALSFWQRLELEWSLLFATLRSTVQLLVVASLLWFIFDWKHPLAVLAVVGVMLLIATIETRNRIGKDVPQLVWLVGGALLVSVFVTLTYTTILVIRPDNWFDPQYLIPLAGIVLGNCMSGAAIAGERLIQSFRSHRYDIETHLCLGATPQQAIAPYRRAAIRAGLIPTINAMMVVGVVKLPGIITGQLLSGIDPRDAASYQLLILFMLAFGTLLTTVLVVEGFTRQFFNRAAQFHLPL